ncbi:hypothetical protein X971_1065 [Agrobacterium tumefaciens LBA4213 (Ach5)]|nr:hypothetical protein X971_1065 [Agrobacterium tumefaciens LBA4213 (Ach5)]
MSVFFFDYVFSINVLVAMDDAQYAQFILFNAKIDTAIFVVHGAKAVADPVSRHSREAQSSRVFDLALNG